MSASQQSFHDDLDRRKQEVKEFWATAKRKFREFDEDGSGKLEGKELGELAKWAFETTADEAMTDAESAVRTFPFPQADS